MRKSNGLYTLFRRMRAALVVKQTLSFAQWTRYCSMSISGTFPRL